MCSGPGSGPIIVRRANFRVPDGAVRGGACQNERVVNKTKKPYVDNGWPETANGDHAVTELSSTRSGSLSPYGEDTEFPLPADQLPYVHPHTIINR